MTILTSEQLRALRLSAEPGGFTPADPHDRVLGRGLEHHDLVTVTPSFAFEVTGTGRQLLNRWITCSPSLAKGLRLVQNGTIQPFERRRHAVQRALEVSGARGLMHKAARSCCGGGGWLVYCPATDEWFDARAQLVTPPEQEAQRESLRHAMTLFLEHALVCEEHKKFMRKHKLIEWAGSFWCISERGSKLAQEFGLLIT